MRTFVFDSKCFFLINSREGVLKCIQLSERRTDVTYYNLKDKIIKYIFQFYPFQISKTSSVRIIDISKSMNADQELVNNDFNRFLEEQFPGSQEPQNHQSLTSQYEFRKENEENIEVYDNYNRDSSASTRRFYR